MAGGTRSDSEWYPGQVFCAEGHIESLTGPATRKLTVTNTGDRPVQVGSHFHFFEINKMLLFHRPTAYGMRLAIPAGTAVRFEPGQSQDVELTPLLGERVVYGLNGLVSGRLDDAKIRDKAMKAAKKQGFQSTDWKSE